MRPRRPDADAAAGSDHKGIGYGAIDGEYLSRAGGGNADVASYIKTTSRGEISVCMSNVSDKVGVEVKDGI
ncbi:hypothetical protein ES703_82539 [subsurface metagenome]